tara:strand:- start:640 stop:1080 length:441 start_codon:yes stop_codon:yes gene_type:complete
MKSKDKTFRQLLEQVREYDDLIVLPDEIKFNTRTKNNASINNLRRAVEDFNKFPNDKDSLMKLKRAFNNAMTVIIELLDENLQNSYNHRLEMKKKDYVIDNLKKYIESKEDLDAEIPSDEDEEEKSDEKELKGLSRKERDILKSIK